MTQNLKYPNIQSRNGTPGGFSCLLSCWVFRKLAQMRSPQPTSTADQYRSQSLVHLDSKKRPSQTLMDRSDLVSRGLRSKQIPVFEGPVRSGFMERLGRLDPGGSCSKYLEITRIWHRTDGMARQDRWRPIGTNNYQGQCRASFPRSSRCSPRPRSKAIS